MEEYAERDQNNESNRVLNHFLKKHLVIWIDGGFLHQPLYSGARNLSTSTGRLADGPLHYERRPRIELFAR